MSFFSSRLRSSSPSVSPGPAIATTKKLKITVSDNYESNFQIVPVNSHSPVILKTSIGEFELIVNIKHFVGSKEHSDNSYYNEGDAETTQKPDDSDATEERSDVDQGLANLEIIVKFTPSQTINGSELLFGNDFTYPIRNYLPVTLLSTGLKFFNWFIDPSVKGDAFADMPYLYGTALSSFNQIGVDDAEGSEGSVVRENLFKYATEELKIPEQSAARMKFFTSEGHSSKFQFESSNSYHFCFKTDFISLQDSKYAVSIPTFGNKTFDINILSYLNENLTNVNWVIKQGGRDGVKEGQLGMIMKFQLTDD